MKHIILGLAVCACLVAGVANSAESNRVLVWGQEAMKLTLSVGNERLIEFPQPLIDLQMPNYITSPAMSRPELLPDGRLFWLANDEWEEVRIRAIGADGEVYLLDVDATTAANDNNPIQIIKSEKIDLDRLSELEQSSVPSGGYDYIDLAKYAAQHVYGPSRLVEPLSGVRRTEMNQEPVDIYRGVGLELYTVAQWKSEYPEQYVTILKVVNSTHEDIEIDPRKMRGDWLYAAPHNATVMPFGYMGDTTHIYLVSNQSFYQSIPTMLQARVRESEGVDGR